MLGGFGTDGEIDLAGELSAGGAEVELLILILKLGGKDSEYIEVVFTVLLVSPLVSILSEELSLVAVAVALRANWLSLPSKVGKSSVMRERTLAAVSGKSASMVS